MDDPKAQLIARVIETRTTLKLTQQVFAEKYAIPYRTLINWEQGTRRPDSVSAQFLAMIVTNPLVVEALIKQAGYRETTTLSDPDSQ